MSKKYFGAGALILFYNGQAALFQRSDYQSGYDLPFGKIEDGEGPKAAARRECLQEIGFEIEIFDKAEPFVGTMKSNGKLCITYLAKPKKIVLPSHEEEGSLFIGDPRLLLSGKYADYNGRMLDHFGKYLNGT